MASIEREKAAKVRIARVIGRLYYDVESHRLTERISRLGDSVSDMTAAELVAALGRMARQKRSNENDTARLIAAFKWCKNILDEG